LGGWAAAVFGYEVAFLINAASFLASAFSVWLIPEEATREQETATRQKIDNEILESPAIAGALPKTEEVHKRPSFIRRLKGRFSLHNQKSFRADDFDDEHHLGDRRRRDKRHFRANGRHSFCRTRKPEPGYGGRAAVDGERFRLVRRDDDCPSRLDVSRPQKLEQPFYRLDADNSRRFVCSRRIYADVVAFYVFCFVSRAIVGVEYAVQETMFQRSLPDYIRGRISTLDRGAEMTVFGLTSYFSSELMLYISPQLLTVISGILSASAGVLWFVRMRGGKRISYRSKEILRDA
jgi:hypothetical protein